ncbi:MAG TPA: class I SAM-dependent methyltransferase [Lysobacter sp.]
MRELIDRIGRTYDEVPYVSSAFHLSAPEHLRAVAHLFGLDAPLPGRARVLELGCSAGGNLIPFAVRHPDAETVGVDLSPVQVDTGRRLVEAMGLHNVRLIQGSLADLDIGLGRFDYIVCHGVYSWVPDEVRAAILRVCNELLSPDGVAYVSYNTYPGWKAKEIVRDAMLLRGGPRDTARERLAYARGMIEFLHEQASDGSVLATVMKEHIDMIRDGKDYYLNHEYMELCNAPCYFRDFVQAARVQGLEYLGDASVASMFAANYGASAKALLNECGGDQILLEQLIDFLVNRAFRQTLLVHADRGADIRYQLDHARIRALHVAGFYTPQGDGGEPAQDWKYAGGASVRTSSPVTRRVVERLNAAWPATVPVDALVEGLAPGETTQAIGLVSNLIVGNAIAFRREPVAPAALSDRPVARAELRALAASGSTSVSPFNEWHELVRLEALERFVLQKLDGSVDRDRLVADVIQAIADGVLTFHRDGQPLLDAGEVAAAVPRLVDHALRWLAAGSMLGVAPVDPAPIPAKPARASKAKAGAADKAPRGRK